MTTGLDKRGRRVVNGKGADLSMKSPRAPLALLFLFAVAAPVRAEDPTTLNVTLHDARLSVNARAASLQHILAEISRVSGISVYLEAGLETQLGDETTTVALEDLTVEEGLRRLLRHKNFIFAYSSTGLAEVKVYVEGTGDFHRLPVETQRSGERGPAAQQGAVRLRAEALGNPDALERSRALSRLAESGNLKLAVETALEVLERERDSEVLESALDLLLGAESVPLDPILKLAASAREVELRVQALEILGEHGKRDPRVSELLKTLAKSDKDNEVRETAESLLEDIESE